MENPRLRPLEVFPVQASGQSMIGLRDPAGYAEQTLFLPQPLFFIISMLDGQHSILDIQAEYMRRQGELLFRDKIEEIVAKLDENLFLDSPRFRRHLQKVSERFQASPVRPAFNAGKSYRAAPDELDQEIRGLFVGEDGPGLPDDSRVGPRLKGAILPHMDYARGKSCYAYGYKQLAESKPVDLFVILGTCHADLDGSFCLTEKDFQTPFGVLKTDKGFVRALAQKYGDDPFKEELAQRAEHSIELQTVLIQNLLGRNRKVEIVPILCGSFQQALKDNVLPVQLEEVGRFINALKQTVAETDKRILIIASGDFSHMGPRFGDGYNITATYLGLIEREDLADIKLLEGLDADGFFRSVASSKNGRKICGWPSFYVLLKVIDARRGKLLKYCQWPDPQGTVSFASIAFY
ncbi:MAG: AmmeMemoRadiSam system protein B [Thermodesulfobacteriota bacterium]